MHTTHVINFLQFRILVYVYRIIFLPTSDANILFISILITIFSESNHCLPTSQSTPHHRHHPRRGRKLPSPRCCHALLIPQVLLLAMAIGLIIIVAASLCGMTDGKTHLAWATEPLSIRLPTT